MQEHTHHIPVTAVALVATLARFGFGASQHPAVQVSATVVPALPLPKVFLHVPALVKAPWAWDKG